MGRPYRSFLFMQGAPTEPGASVSIAEQVWQLGDVAGDAACLSEIFLVRQGTGESVMTFWLVALAQVNRAPSC